MSSRALCRTTGFLLLVCVGAFAQTSAKVETVFDEGKNLRTTKLGPVRLAGDSERYHNLDFTLIAEYPGNTKQKPEQISFDLVSVVKARRLNTDLYVVFVIDGREVHFGSNRSAIRNPVPGRLWIGERMTFSIPYDDFVKMTSAQKLAIKMGSITFDFDDKAKNALTNFLAQ